jgi:hypothetical protein
MASSELPDVLKKLFSGGLGEPLQKSDENAKADADSA